MSEPEDLRIIRVRELAALLGVSTMTLWRWGQAGNFPAKVRLGANSVGYRSSVGWPSGPGWGRLDRGLI